MRGFEGRLGKQHAEVGYYTYRETHDMGETTYYGSSIPSLKLLKTAAINDTHYHLARIHYLAKIYWSYAIQLFRVV